MAVPSHEFVAKLRTRAWLRILYVLVIAYGAWFTVVLVGEQRAFADDPGMWAFLPTRTWALIGIALFFVAAIYALVLLLRREVPAQTYTVPDSGDSTPPQYLEPAAAEAAPGQPVTAEAERPPQS